MNSPADSLRPLMDAARAQLEGGSCRAVIQVGHCSASVGAAELAGALRAASPSGVDLVVAGCDGACHDAPKLTISHVDGTVTALTRVDPASAGRLTAAMGRCRTDHLAVPVPGMRPVGEFLASQRRIVLDGVGDVDPASLDEYLLRGGYAALAKALSSAPEAAIAEVKDSGLRGRGGAYFPAAIKWESARKFPEPKYLVVNCEEGEPGIFKDRHIMEGMPHRLLEGTIIAAYASGASTAYAYVNAEADLSAERLQAAIDQAYESGLLGDDILGSGFALDVQIRRGAGGYVCGDETTLLNTMEGYRREPRIKPPLPIESGLWGKPTVINNAETLASVPFIVTEGASAFMEIGANGDAGTKLISLSGSVRRPGLVEVPMGTTLREIIYGLGGGPADDREITAIAVGGPSSGVLPASMLDTPIAPGSLHESGVMLGAGGVVPLDDTGDVLQVVRHLAAYNADESCGKCTPCREGTPRIVDGLDRLIAGDGSKADLDELRQLADVVELASLCGLGQAAGGPVKSALHFFPDELTTLADRRNS